MFAFMAGQPDEFRRYLVFSSGELKYYDRCVGTTTTECGFINAASSKTTGFHTYSVAVRGAAYMDGIQKINKPFLTFNGIEPKLKQKRRYCFVDSFLICIAVT
jgi:hypothetical protein